MTDAPAEPAAPLVIPARLLSGRPLVRYPEASLLVPAETAPNGRVHRLIPEAAVAWARMKSAAAGDGVDLHILSGFRSVARQEALIRERMARGLTLESVLRVLAPPGYSEHHTGCAVDIATTGIRTLQLEFEGTPAFAWLQQHASVHGFLLSYPRGNAEGYAFEPWHWCYRRRPAA